MFVTTGWQNKRVPRIFIFKDLGKQGTALLYQNRPGKGTPMRQLHCKTPGSVRIMDHACEGKAQGKHGGQNHCFCASLL